MFEDYKNIGLGFGMQPGGQSSQLGVGSGMSRALVSAQGGNNFDFNSEIDTNTFGGAPGAPDLGDKSFNFANKAGLGLGIAQTGLNAYLGFKGQKLARDQYNQSKYQFNTNLNMQKASMGGQLSDRYMNANDPSKLAGSEKEYLAKYGL